MKSVQPIKFKDVDDLISALPDNERAIVTQLRTLIFHCIPDCDERLSYNVPFYYQYSRVCFIWPASIPWGNIQEGVALGFCKGHQMRDELQYLQMDKRKSVARKIFKDAVEIDVDVIKVYLEEAADVDRRMK